MQDGVATVVEREGRPAQSAAPASWSKEPVKFYSEHGGSQILGRNASMSDIVDLGGLIGQTTVGSALHNGWLVETEAGGFERAGQAKAPAEPRAPRRDAQQDAEPEQQQPKAPEQTRQEPQREYMAHEHEAACRKAETLVGAQTFAAIENIMTDPDAADIPESLLGHVARALGTTPEGARVAITQTAAPLVAQASATVDQFLGDGMSEAAFEWARTDRQGKELLRKAMQGQLDERNLAGYREVAAGYLAHLAKADPHAVAQGLVAGGTRAKVEGGKVLVDLGKDVGGWTEFVSAVRGGVVRLGR